MDHNTLRRAIADLATIDRDGLLPEVRMAFSLACREAGGIPAREWRRVAVDQQNLGDVMRADDVAKTASELFNRPLHECRRLAREAIVVDRWSQLALETIAEYLPSEPAAEPKRKAERTAAGGRRW